MKRRGFQVTPSLMVPVTAMIGLCVVVALMLYILNFGSNMAQAPGDVFINSFRDKNKESAEKTLKSYLEDLKVKDKSELSNYYSAEFASTVNDIESYYGDKDISIESFEILKTEKAGNDAYVFTVKEVQKDKTYGIVGYMKNKYKMSKQEAGFLISFVEPGEFTDTSDTKDWKLVRDVEKGYEIKYPESFFYQDPEITISSMSGSSSLSGCYARNFKGFIVRKVNIGGSEYCLSESTGAAAGSTYVDSSYTNVEKNRIATLHFIVRYSNCGSFGAVDDPAFKKCEEENASGPKTVERVVSTFKFISGE